MSAKSDAFSLRVAIAGMSLISCGYGTAMIFLPPRQVNQIG